MIPAGKPDAIAASHGAAITQVVPRKEARMRSLASSMWAALIQVALGLVAGHLLLQKVQREVTLLLRRILW